MGRACSMNGEECVKDFGGKDTTRKTEVSRVRVLVGSIIFSSPRRPHHLASYPIGTRSTAAGA
jgi:hypothetical protein